MVNPLISGAYKSSSTANASGAANNQRKSALDMASFLTLLTTQLANQNPLEPMNDRDFFAQLAQLGTVQGIDKLSTSMDVTQANAMLGKHVTALRPASGGILNDTLVDGTVTGMATRDGTKYLQITEKDGGVVEVTPDAIQSISNGSSSGVGQALEAANAANLVGKNISAPHPTLKNETLTAKVSKVSFAQGQVLLTVKDRLGNDVKVDLTNVTSFSE